MLLQRGTGIAACAFGTSVARKSSSSAYVVNDAARTTPELAGPAGSSGRLAAWSAYNGPASWLAAVRMRASERRLTLSGNRSSPSPAARAGGKPRPNCSMLLTEAPRQP